MFGDADQQQLIQIDTEPMHMGLNRPVDVALVGDADVVLTQLLEAVKIRTSKRNPHPKIVELRTVQDDWQKELDDAVADMERTPMLSGQVLKVCNDFFPDNAIRVMDGGNTTLWSIHYHVARAQRSVMYSMNYGHLGTGLPYAIGAKLARPDKTVCCVSGDSAFGFNLQELETAVRLQLPVIIIVAVDGAFGMEKSAQRRAFGREAEWFGHDHAPVRYDQVAVAMGCHGEFVEKGSEIQPALVPQLYRSTCRSVHPGRSGQDWDHGTFRHRLPELDFYCCARSGRRKGVRTAHRPVLQKAEPFGRKTPAAQRAEADRQA
jgi:acetolactate synthase-1/2/3 large subunit